MVLVGGGKQLASTAMVLFSKRRRQIDCIQRAEPRPVRLPATVASVLFRLNNAVAHHSVLSKLGSGNPMPRSPSRKLAASWKNRTTSFRWTLPSPAEAQLCSMNAAVQSPIRPPQRQRIDGPGHAVAQADQHLGLDRLHSPDRPRDCAVRSGRVQIVQLAHVVAVIDGQLEASVRTIVICAVGSCARAWRYSTHSTRRRDDGRRRPRPSASATANGPACPDGGAVPASSSVCGRSVSSTKPRCAGARSGPARRRSAARGSPARKRRVP